VLIATTVRMAVAMAAGPLGDTHASGVTGLSARERSAPLPPDPRPEEQLVGAAPAGP
jgi:hypothetical protein